MTPKQKIILSYPFLLLRNRRARKLAKKAVKPGNEERYPIQWKQDYVLKKAKKFLKTFNVVVEVEGYEDLPKGISLLAPNHASSLDAAIMVAALENPSEEADQLNTNSVFIAKKELLKNKKFSGYFKLKDTFFIDRKNPRQALKTLDEMVEFAKKNKTNIVIFPEGTRSLTGELSDFKAGTFRIAKKSFIPVVPVTISNSLSATSVNRKKKLIVKVVFHKAIKPMEIISAGTQNIAKKVQKTVQSKLEKPEITEDSSLEKKI